VTAPGGNPRRPTRASWKRDRNDDACGPTRTIIVATTEAQ
jgi:hypothetical protein